MIPRRILPLIVLAQFCCTSLWFAGNAVLVELVETFGLPDTALGSLTSAIQFGFICGTLVFAILAIADRFSPSWVFFASAIAGATFNLAGTWPENTLLTLLSGRFMTGFFLAGIYPVGMKIAADYYQKDLGKSLGFLVGALVLGTAFPHLLRGFGEELPWKSVLFITSGLAVLGGGLILAFVPDGPHRSKGSRPDFTAFFTVFRNRPFRAAAFGYFGHMWELYAFWAFVPLLLGSYLQTRPEASYSLPVMAFLIIGAGGVGCVVSGLLSLRYGARKVATTALFLSGVCCLLAPVAFHFSPALFLSFLLVWGVLVVADSPLFSTLVAGSAAPERKGTALTIVNCLGFALTIVSIQLLVAAGEWLEPAARMPLLAIGPALGLLGLFADRKRVGE
ncbi:MFS transporter [Neolewinella persica]|uniref:MFS transporter n=1 Tax=Neolewinella persica TaxID=70998 RepID=UPI0003685C5E|nr:MFS transporter [Neolewinella persica]